MDLQGAKPQNGPRRAWARTGALILFLVTGVLLVASLNSARSQHQPALDVEAGTAGQETL